MDKRLSALVAAVTGNLIIVVPFAVALFNPSGNTDFIFKTAPLLFVIEFLSVHSASMLLNKASGQMGKTRFFLLPVYALFALVFGFAVGSFYPPVMFLLSLVIKLLFHKSSPEGDIRIVTNILLLMATAFLVVFMEDFLRSTFPFPKEVMDQKPADASGIFVDTPQTALFWGVLYYGLTIFLEIKQFKNPKFLNFIKIQKVKQ